MDESVRLPRPHLVSIGTATPAHSYSQQALLDLFEIDDERIRSIYLRGSIERRFLELPPTDASGRPQAESQQDLLHKHRNHGTQIGASAVRACLERAGLAAQDVRHLCCVTSTGFLVPGLSVLLCQALGLSASCSRLDVVGMGCNAGLNGLSSVATWAQAHPGELAVMVCVEMCSAAYVVSDNLQTAVVNSLFGDGAAAVALRAAPAPERLAPALLKFSSFVIPQTVDAMRFQWDDAHGKFSFLLGRDVPYVVGAHVEGVVDALLEGTGVRRSEIAHWLVHSGGKKVIDSVRMNLRLSRHELRHTLGVLRDYGNLSSGSFLFSCERLLQEGCVRDGDYGVMMTMGPGSTIETALVRWSAAEQG